MIKKKDHLDKRFKLIKKYVNNKKYKPSAKELHVAYGYLDYCCWCGKELKWFDAYSHGFEGNCHKFGCSNTSIVLGWLYNLVAIPIKILIALIFLPFALLIWLGSWIQEKMK